MKFKVLIVVGLSLIFSISIFAQQKNIEKLTQKNVRLVQNKPTFYIEFVRVGKHRIEKPFIPSQADDAHLPPPEKFKPQEVNAVWLRLYNNSKWAIKTQVGMDDIPNKLELKELPDKQLGFTPTAKAELDIVYGVEPINAEAILPKNLTQNVPFTRLYGTITDLWILSGQSVVFMVRREELQKNLQIFFPFKYEWEVSKDERGYEEPQHRAYFDWVQFENAIGK